jgi:hypothetical protein
VLVETGKATGGRGTIWKPIDRQQVDALAAKTVLKRAA